MYNYVESLLIYITIAERRYQWLQEVLLWDCRVCCICSQYRITPLLKSVFLSPISSFFVVEDTILHTSQSLISQKASSEGREEGLSTTKTVQEFWQMALAELLAVLRNNCVRIICSYTLCCCFQTCFKYIYMYVRTYINVSHTMLL